MDEFKLYSVSDEYVEWLRKDYPNVYSNKIDSRTHTRKYLGVVLQIEQYKYYIPMSSPKESDYQITGENKVIKKSIVPIIRIVVKNAKLMYKQKKANDITAGYVKSALDYQALERLCDLYKCNDCSNT